MLSGLPFGWMQAGPKFVASRVSFHFGIGSGAFQRRAPTGGSAYGMPLNARTLPDATPCSLPAGADTTGGESAMAGSDRTIDINNAHAIFMPRPRVSARAPATSAAAPRAHRKESTCRTPIAGNAPDWRD